MPKQRRRRKKKQDGDPEQGRNFFVSLAFWMAFGIALFFAVRWYFG